MKRPIRQFILAVLGIACLAASAFAAAETQITWLGHGAFKIQTPSGKVLVTDPWILHALNPNAVEDFGKLKRTDLILVSHGHANSLGDAFELAEKSGAKLLVSTQLKRGLLANRKFTRQHFTADPIVDIGMPLSYFDNEVRITLMPAEHRTVSENPADSTMRNNTIYAHPYTFVIEIKGGPTIFHAGDSTLLDEEFAEIAKRYKVDVMLVGIGGKFTPSPHEAAEMTVTIKPKMVIPMRFGGVPGMDGTPSEFGEALKKSGATARLQELKPGETFRYP